MNSNLKQNLRQGIRAGLTLLFPPRCPGCGEVLRAAERADGFCASCRRKTAFQRDPICVTCGKSLPEGTDTVLCSDCRNHRHAFTAARSVWIYEGPVKNALYRFKYSNERVIASVLAEGAAEHLGSWIREIGPDVLVPVPVYRKKYRERGYNQAEVFARALSERTGIPVCSSCLCRVRDTPPQKELGRAGRRRNLIHAFQCRGTGVELKKVMLIDDIYTTGTTADLCADALKKAGAAGVWVLCAAGGRGQ